MTLENLFDGILAGAWIWGAKRLSANDVGDTHSHQAGVYLPAFFVRNAFGDALASAETLNPRIEVPYEVIGREGVIFPPVTVIYYNNRFVAGGTRNEFRITRWRQGEVCAYGEEDVGNVLLLAVSKVVPKRMVVFVARNLQDETALQERLGFDDLAPGDFATSEVDPMSAEFRIPSAWLGQFPDTREVSNYVFANLVRWEAYPNVDELLLARRVAEQRLFTRLEDFHIRTRISRGFETTADFTQYALSVLNRRKARSGKSLEHNLADIFIRSAIRFSAQATTEQHKHPDFLFPSETCYHMPYFPTCHLHMMGAKTTCKDRWRQILNEADRISSPFLFTLDGTITTTQYEEMRAAHVRLVVPEPILREMPQCIRSTSMTLSAFVAFQQAEQSRESVRQYLEMR